jgi:cell division protein FtsZ
MIELEQEQDQLRIVMKVIGVGGAGGNTVNSMVEAGYSGIEFIVTNTDAQALQASRASKKIQLGVKSTKGLGSGANPELGRRAAEEDLDKIMEAIGESDVVFLTAGMGGGTGSGALPVIARALKNNGALTIAIVTKPFAFEGKRRARIADQAIELLKKEVDTLLVIQNQKLLGVVDEHVSMIDAFAMINEILHRSVKGISDIITKPGHINVDFADMREIMKGMGLAVMGTGTASGKNRAKEAAERAISSPLLENMSISGARGVLLNITGGRSLGLHEISQAAEVIYQQADEEANIIIGSAIDESLEEEVVVTVIATGFVPVVEAQKQIEPIKTVAVHAAKVEEEAPITSPKIEEPVMVAPIDVNDLDVPTFLRKQQQPDESVEQQ